MCRYKIKVSLLAYLFLFYLPVLAQHIPAWELNSYSSLFKLEPYKASSISSNPAEQYLDAYKAALANIIFEYPKNEDVKYKLASTNQLIDDSSIPENFKLYYKMDLSMLSSYLELKEGNELQFMWMMNDVHKMSGKLSSNYPDFVPGKKMAGVLNIMIAAVPVQYQWVLNLLGYNGSTSTGLSYLDEISSSNLPIKYESVILSVMLKRFLNLSSIESTTTSLNIILHKQPDFSLMKLIAALIYIKQHNSDEALMHLNKLEEKNLPFLKYLLGEIYLQRGEHLKAVTHFESFINTTRTSNLVKDAYTKIFINYHIMGAKEQATNYHNLALRSGSTYSEADKNAQQILQEDQWPHPLLFKIRYATDGGYFKDALLHYKEALRISLNLKDKIELIYRGARLFHLSGNELEAIEAYKKVIDNYDGRYFAPNSALQLGYIFEVQGETALARRYYEKAMEFKGYPYQNSISSKARRALKNIEQ